MSVINGGITLLIHENPLTLEEIESALNLQISNQKDVATYLQNPSRGLLIEHH